MFTGLYPPPPASTYTQKHFPPLSSLIVETLIKSLYFLFAGTPYITQVTAVNRESFFSMYVKRKIHITARALKVTGLTYTRMSMFYQGMFLVCYSLHLLLKKRDWHHLKPCSVNSLCCWLFSKICSRNPLPHSPLPLPIQQMPLPKHLHCTMI